MAEQKITKRAKKNKEPEARLTTPELVEKISALYVEHEQIEEKKKTLEDQIVSMVDALLELEASQLDIQRHIEKYKSDLFPLRDRVRQMKTYDVPLRMA